MSKVLGFVLGLILVVTAEAGTRSSWIFHTSSLPTEDWKYVCAIRDIDCKDIPPPIIVNAIPYEQYYGLYEPAFSPNVIFVNPSIDPIEKRSTAIHEASHYLDWQTGRL